MRGPALLCSAIAIGLLSACADSSTETLPQFVAFLHPMKEVPAVTTSSARGEFQASIEGNTMTYTVTFDGLTSNSIGAHIHGPATTSQAVGVLVDFNNAAAGRNITLGAVSGTGSGTIDISPTAAITATVNGDSLRKLLLAGRLYVNVHSVNFPGGEVRGQIVK